ncbi:PREDICTED: uncharacterized protein LOC109481610 [Branchiostoma belcheri]|uniref:Uncharacterized protein LOC109481610 n=1 Tax=Branchiostoma belcheri TaxID=7741 RepID=A0A6P5ADB8_BRABE|nr:PREDICTED: uncharacterized protein LOC109481610 [Branchiostoma belcheri]
MSPPAFNYSGEMTAFSESAWSPDKGKNNGVDMQWGGGSLFVSEDERQDTDTGGIRKLSHRRAVPTVDLSRWIQANFAVEDDIVFKLDVEGAEYAILKKMLKDGTFRWIDKFYGEFHPFQPTGLSWSEKDQLMDELAKKKITQLSWAAEDIEELHQAKVPRGTSGTAGTVYRSCGFGSPSVPGRVSLVIEVGMNAKMAHRLIETIRAYRVYIPLSVFVYGDFAELFPEMVLNWSLNHTVGVREGHPYPPGHFDIINPRWIRTNVIISVLRLHELGLQPAFYLPASTGKDITGAAAQRNLRVVYPTARFPPTKGTLLIYNNYYYYRDVERVPKALRMISSALGQNGADVRPRLFSRTVNVGDAVTLEMVRNPASTRTGALEWRKNGVVLQGQTALTLNINNVQSSDEGIYECYYGWAYSDRKQGIMRLMVRACSSGRFGKTCRFSCSGGCQGQLMTVPDPRVRAALTGQAAPKPVIVHLETQPVTRKPERVAVDVRLAGRDRKNGVVLQGQTALTLNINNVQSSDEGIYECYYGGAYSDRKQGIMRLMVRGKSYHVHIIIIIWRLR